MTSGVVTLFDFLEISKFPNQDNIKSQENLAGNPLVITSLPDSQFKFRFSQPTLVTTNGGSMLEFSQSPLKFGLPKNVCLIFH